MKYKHILEVHAKEWFDKVNGNSYFSARVTLDDIEVARLPYQYGYGSQNESEAFNELKTLALPQLAPITDKDYSLSAWCRDNDIKLITSKQEGCLKRDMQSWGRS